MRCRSIPNARSLWGAIAASILAACTGAGVPHGLPTVADSRAPQAVSPVAAHIKHVVIIVQENRSFDNIFDGFPGARTSRFGTLHTGAKVALHRITFAPVDGCGCDLYHGYEAGYAEYDGGKMDRFDTFYLSNGKIAGTYPYAYLARDQVAPYWEMARRYTLADQMFPTEFGPSFTGHLALIAGTTSLNSEYSLVDLPSALPWGCGAPAQTYTQTLEPNRNIVPGPSPCLWQFHTLADTLDARHVSWAYYAPRLAAPDKSGAIWSSFDAIESVRNGPDWLRDVISPQTKVLQAPSRGTLPSVAWVVPDYVDSDHSENGSDRGPSWVAAVVNAIGTSKYWDSTAIFVLWDDWGGWFDDAPPPQLDVRGLGIRVPLIVISPYARAGYVSHTRYEFGSVIRFVDETFGLRPLAEMPGYGYTDERANSIAGAFDFSKPPRPFVPIAAKYPAASFVRERESLKAPDDW